VIEEYRKYSIRVAKSLPANKQYAMDETHGEIPFHIIIIIFQFNLSFKYFLDIFKGAYLILAEIFKKTDQ